MSSAWIDDLRRDLRYAARMLVRSPAFATVVILTLAVGIGANTAMFTVVHSVLLTPLPYADSSRLVRVWENVPGAEIGDGKGQDFRFPEMDVRDLVDASKRAKTVTHLAAYGLVQTTAATPDGDVTRLEGFSVSGDFFPMLGVRPVIGRTIEPDDGAAGRDHVVVLDYDTWKRLGGSADLVGKTLTFAGDARGPFTGGIAFGAPYTIIGVMPAGFRFLSDNVQLWVPRPLVPSADGRPTRRQTIARLAPGATPEAAAAELAAIRAAARGTSSAAKIGARQRYELIRLQEELTASVRPALLVLSAAVAIVLLIACVNVANLLLARGLSRHREFAVRAAVGAAKGRMVRQLLTESLVLSVAGGAAGCVVAAFGVRLFRALGATLGRSDLGNTVVFPRLAEVRLDGAVLGYAAAISIATGLMFGLVPALRNARAPAIDAFRESTASGRTRLKSVLVVIEIAMATVLIVAGGLVIRSFARLATIDPGFNPARVLTFQVSTQRASEKVAFAEALVERLRASGRIESAGYAQQLPMVALKDVIRLTILRDGVEQRFDDAPDIRFVSHDYLNAIGVPLLTGRGLTERDDAGRPPVVVINEALARRNFAGTNPIGQTILLGPPTRRIAMEIVGVVGNVRQSGLDRPADSQYFIDIRQVPTDPAFRMPPLFPIGAYYVVRTAGDPTSVLADVRGIVRQLDPSATLDRVATLEQIVSNSMTRPRTYTVLVAIFSAIALTLALVGLYGVMSYTVTQRTREIGIRMALGATGREVRRLVLTESGGLISMGLACGLVAAAATTRYLEGLLFGMKPLDPATFAVAALAFVGVAMLAAYVPARRATTIQPVDALRCE